MGSSASSATSGATSSSADGTPTARAAVVAAAASPLLALVLHYAVRAARRTATATNAPPPKRTAEPQPRKYLLTDHRAIGLDIGGSLAKLVFLEKPDAKSDFLDFIHRSATYGRTGVRDESLAIKLPELGGCTMHFIRFETAQVAAAIVLMQENQLCSNLSTFYCTGGGAHKFGALIEEALGVQLHACSELGTVVLGICFMTCMVDDECFTYDYVADTAAPQPPGADTSQRTIVQAVRPSRDSQRRPSIVSDSGSSGDVQRIPFSLNSRSADFFPFLLCNVGTGCSILQVHSETRWERISGTALGGGTFLGLCRRLTEARGFAEAVAMAERGDARKVDMLVRDIYGDGDKQSGLNLPGDLTASFFARNLGAPGRIASDDADICKALDVMVAQNVAQIAHLNAQVHGLKRVFFTGNFLRGNELASKTIVYTMRRLPRLPGASASTEAVFFKHEGYFGAIGAFLEQLA